MVVSKKYAFTCPSGCKFCVVFVFAIKSLLVCYCACSLSLNIFAFKEIISRNYEIKTSSTDVNITNPEERRKWFSRSVASMTNICSWGRCFIIVPVLVCVIKNINKCRWINREINKFSKRINNSEERSKFMIWPAKFNSNTHPFDFPTPASCNFESPHPQPNQKTFQLLWPAEIIMPCSP